LHVREARWIFRAQTARDLGATPQRAVPDAGDVDHHPIEAPRERVSRSLDPVRGLAGGSLRSLEGTGHRGGSSSGPVDGDGPRTGQPQALELEPELLELSGVQVRRPELTSRSDELR